MKGPIDGAVNELNLSCGNFIRISCNPLRRYEEFAKSVLNVDEALTTPLKNPLTLDGDAFLVDARVDYHGKSFEELVEIWQREAQAALTTRQKGTEIDLFKIVPERRGSADDLDNMIFKLPMPREMGDQIQITANGITAI